MPTEDQEVHARGDWEKGGASEEAEDGRRRNDTWRRTCRRWCCRRASIFQFWNSEDGGKRFTPGRSRDKEKSRRGWEHHWHRRSGETNGGRDDKRWRSKGGINKCNGRGDEQLWGSKDSSWHRSHGCDWGVFASKGQPWSGEVWPTERSSHRLGGVEARWDWALGLRPGGRLLRSDGSDSLGTALASDKQSAVYNLLAIEEDHQQEEEQGDGEAWRGSGQIEANKSLGVLQTSSVYGRILPSRASQGFIKLETSRSSRAGGTGRDVFGPKPDVQVRDEDEGHEWQHEACPQGDAVAHEFQADCGGVAGRMWKWVERKDCAQTRAPGGWKPRQGGPSVSSRIGGSNSERSEERTASKFQPQCSWGSCGWAGARWCRGVRGHDGGVLRWGIRGKARPKAGEAIQEGRTGLDPQGAGVREGPCKWGHRTTFTVKVVGPEQGRQWVSEDEEPTGGEGNKEIQATAWAVGGPRYVFGYSANRIGLQPHVDVCYQESWEPTTPLGVVGYFPCTLYGKGGSYNFCTAPKWGPCERRGPRSAHGRKALEEHVRNPRRKSHIPVRLHGTDHQGRWRVQCTMSGHLQDRQVGSDRMETTSWWWGLMRVSERWTRCWTAGIRPDGSRCLAVRMRRIRRRCTFSTGWCAMSQMERTQMVLAWRWKQMPGTWKSWWETLGSTARQRAVIPQRIRSHLESWWRLRDNQCLGSTSLVSTGQWWWGWHTCQWTGQIFAIRWECLREQCRHQRWMTCSGWRGQSGIWSSIPTWRGCSRNSTWRTCKWWRSVTVTGQEICDRGGLHQEAWWRLASTRCWWRELRRRWWRFHRLRASTTPCAGQQCWQNSSEAFCCSGLEEKGRRGWRSIAAQQRAWLKGRVWVRVDTSKPSTCGCKRKLQPRSWKSTRSKERSMTVTWLRKSSRKGLSRSIWRDWDFLRQEGKATRGWREALARLRYCRCFDTMTWRSRRVTGGAEM